MDIKLDKTPSTNPRSLACVIISADFVREWQAFVKRPEIHSPPDINSSNQSLYCVHDPLLQVDFNLTADWTSEVVHLKPEDWESVEEV